MTLSVFSATAEASAFTPVYSLPGMHICGFSSTASSDNASYSGKRHEVHTLL